MSTAFAMDANICTKNWFCFVAFFFFQNHQAQILALLKVFETIFDLLRICDSIFKICL